MRISSESSVTQLAQAATGQPAARWSAEERAQVYRLVLGSPGGSGGEVTPNRQFNDLWLRFIASVVQLNRQQPALPHAPASLSSESVQGLARDLAAKFGQLIGDASSGRDLWQVVDHVATAELGGAINNTRHRTMAEAGGAILEWLANLSSATAPSDGTDFDLVQAAEQWLAVSSTQDANAQSLSQPEETQRVAAWSQSLHAALQSGGAGAGLDLRAPKGAVLFSGSGGTGKTLAAHWLAVSLGRDVLRIDLERVVSRYIGETEKNLDAIFAQAQRSDAVLLFDEAEALFGKRTDVKDGHDRYANLDVNYLLQRVESYDGLAILTTNGDAQIDPDLLKKLRAVVAFPLPPRP